MCVGGACAMCFPPQSNAARERLPLGTQGAERAWWVQNGVGGAGVERGGSYVLTVQ